MGRYKETMKIPNVRDQFQGINEVTLSSYNLINVILWLSHYFSCKKLRSENLICAHE